MLGYPTEFRFDKSFKHTAVTYSDCDCTPHEQNPRNSTQPAVVFIPVLNREIGILKPNETQQRIGTIFVYPLLGVWICHLRPLVASGASPSSPAQQPQSATTRPSQCFKPPSLQTPARPAPLPHRINRTVSIHNPLLFRFCPALNCVPPAVFRTPLPAVC